MKKILLFCALYPYIFTLTCMEIRPNVFLPPEVYRHTCQPLDNSKRPASLPYLTGDTFRSLAQFFIDELRLPLNPDNIQEGDIVFLKTELIDYFFTIIHPRIKNPYILVSHNSDSSAPGKYAHFLDDEKLIAWFTQNCDLAHHPKLFPIPIGIANPHWDHGNAAIIDSITRHLPKIKKDTLLYLNIAAQNNPAIRNEVIRLFSHKNFCYNPSPKPWREYLLDMAKSKFVLSPHGNGLDCHRTWEALLMGSIPIVKTSTLDKLYDGLPVLIVNDWNEITEEFLTKKYEEIILSDYDNDKIYAPAWMQEIKECQKTRKAKNTRKKAVTPWIEFNKSMAVSKDYSYPYARKNFFWQRTKLLYDTYILHAADESKQIRIPKIIHQIWVGPKPLPESCRRYQETWKHHHPDWQFILWTDKEIEALDLVNKAKYDAATNYGEKADIARYEILFRLGGLYIDTDFECLKPFDILHELCDFYSGIAFDRDLVVFNGLLGSVPGHPILKTCIETLLNTTNNSTDIMDRTGPYFFTRCIQNHLQSHQDRTILFPVTYFYPWPGIHRFQNSPEQIAQWIKPESFALHHWHTSWQ